MLSTSKNVALLLAAAVSVITTAFLSLVDGVPVEGFIFSAFLSFSSTYILTYFTVEVFIFGQIEKIHDRLNKLKSEDFSFIEEDDNVLLKKNPLTRINSEIYLYAKKKQKEIDELKKAEAFRREFIADISHELKTPIFAAQGFVHTLLDGAINDKNVNKKFLKKAAKSLDGLDRLVQDLLIISQMETGTIRMEFENFDLRELVQEVFDQFEEKVAEKEMEMRFTDNSVEHAWVYADRHKIYQVILNLVSNALKYKKEGKGFVEVHLEYKDNLLYTSIRDNGIGISEKHIKRIFERFYRVDKSRSKEKGGTGLGLSIVKHILEAHKSTMRVESKLDTGSLFTFPLRKGRPNHED